MPPLTLSPLSALSPLSLRDAERRSNLLPDERRNARQAGDCFGAVRLAMTGGQEARQAMARR
jgi:hypothetical protein